MNTRSGKQLCTIILCLVFILLPCNTSLKAKKITPSPSIICNIAGEVINRPQSTALYLVKAGEDMRINKTIVPIQDGKFEFTIESAYEEPYELIFKDEADRGSWMPIKFFAEADNIHMTLHSDEDYMLNKIEGGSVNNEFYLYKTLSEQVEKQCSYHADYILEQFKNVSKKEYLQKIDDWTEKVILPENTPTLYDEIGNLYDQDNYYNEDAKKLREKAESITDWTEAAPYWEKFHQMTNIDRTGLTEDAKKLFSKIDTVQHYFGEWELNRMQNSSSIVAFARLIERMELSINTFMVPPHTAGKTPDYIRLFQTVYEEMYPGHPLTARMQTIINSHMAIQPGGKYIDFSAPDFNNKEVILSQHIEGKITLLNLWASWCGPCRRKGKSMIPVYEDYKDKGFTVVGVAREDVKEYGINAAKQDKYPWLNLLEINDKNNIWNKYGVGNGGGGLFLIDKDGTILAINPTDEEVRNILQEKLGSS